MPLLSICIPTYNRAKILKNNLNRIVREDAFLQTDDVEIIISDNVSTDETEMVCRAFTEKYPDKIFYYRNEKNIEDRNFIEVLKRAKGNFAKLHNDTLCFCPGALSKILDIIKTNQDANLLFFINNSNKNDIVTCQTADEFLNQTSYTSSWIGGLCVNRENFNNIENPDRFSYLHLAQIDIIARMLASGTSVVVNGLYMELSLINKKGGYNIAEIFGKNYLTIMQTLVQEKFILPQTYKNLLKPLLCKHINYYYFDIHNQ